MLSRAIMVAAATAVLGTLSAAAPANALVLSYTGGGQIGTRGSNATVGWAFETNESFEVTSLASQSLGAGSDDIVRLYEANGDILASATLSTGDPTEAIGGVSYYTQSIMPVTLLADTRYFIANDFGGGTQARAFVASITTDPAITYLGDVSSSGQGGTPTGNTLGYSNGYFGPNFDIQLVPEPGSLALMGVAVLGLGLLRNRTA